MYSLDIGMPAKRELAAVYKFEIVTIMAKCVAVFLSLFVLLSPVDSLVRLPHHCSAFTALTHRPRSLGRTLPTHRRMHCSRGSPRYSPMPLISVAVSVLPALYAPARVAPCVRAHVLVRVPGQCGPRAGPGERPRCWADGQPGDAGAGMSAGSWPGSGPAVAAIVLQRSARR